MKSIKHPIGSSRIILYCWKCKTINCCNSSHPRISLNSKTRIPKKDCSKTERKIFLSHLANFPWYVKQLRDKGITDLDCFLNLFWTKNNIDSSIDEYINEIK